MTSIDLRRSRDRPWEPLNFYFRYAAERKLSLTLRQDVLRSHKADGFDDTETMRSFGPRAIQAGRSAKPPSTDDAEAWFCNNPQGDVVQMI